MSIRARAQRRRQAEQKVGHLQHYYAREGKVLKLARYRQAEPAASWDEVDPIRVVFEVVVGLLVIFVLWGGTALLLAALAASVVVR